MLIIRDFNDVVIFISFFIGLLRFRHLTVATKYIFYFVVAGIATEIFTDIFKAHWMRNTMPIGHFYIPISFLILGLFYRSVLNGYVNKKVLSGVIIFYLIFCIINPLLIQSLFDFANITGALSAIILCVFAILLFAKIMSEAKIEKLWSEPIVWINLGILIYHAGNFFFYILFNYSLTISNSFALNTVYFNWIVGMLFYVLISIGFLKSKKQRNQRLVRRF